MSANLIASLPDEHRRQLERIAIGVLSTRSVNAWAVAVPSGGEVICYDFGTMIFLLALNKILLSRISLFGFDPTIDMRAAAERASSIVKRFFGSGQLARFTIPPRRMLIASALSNTQTAFIVGHELGHVLFGHMRYYMENGPPEHPHDQEYAADGRGAELVINGFRNSQTPIFAPGDGVLGLAGIDIFFTYMIFVKKVFGAGDDSDSHPPLRTRREKLRNRFWTELPENARSLAVAAENLFEDFAQITR